MDQKQFSEKLAQITKKARMQGFCISTEEVEQAFGEIIDNEEQRKLLYDYLKEQKISVGDKEDVEIYLSMEDQSYLDSYMEGLGEIVPMGAEELKALIVEAIGGSQSAKEGVLTQFLPKALELAKMYSGQGVLLEDLIGEANLALAVSMENLAVLSGEEDLVKETEGFLGKAMMDGMEQLINEDFMAKDVDERLVDKVNEIAEKAQSLAADLRRSVTPQELADNSEYTLEEIKEALAITNREIEDIDSSKLDS